MAVICLNIYQELKWFETCFKKMFFLSSSLFDLFTAGMETLSTSIQMTVLQMLHHPEVQERVHRELDEVNRKNFKRLPQLIAQWPTNFFRQALYAKRDME